MLLRAMLIDAFHAALENGVIALNRVCVDVYARLSVCIAVLFARMVNRIMLGELVAKLCVALALVSHDVRFAV